MFIGRSIIVICPATFHSSDQEAGCHAIGSSNTWTSVYSERDCEHTVPWFDGLRSIHTI
jgi:hypothetical protein